VRMNEFERDYRMSTMGFKEQHLVWMGRAKLGRWGQGAVNSRGKRQTNVHESAEKRKARVRTVGGSCVSVSSS
jgi:hypothetical protein